MSVENVLLSDSKNWYVRGRLNLNNIKFDVNGIPEMPTLILAKKSADKLGIINAHGIVIKDSFANPCEMTFTIYKVNCDIWNDVTEFKLVWCKEWDKWFEINSVQSEEDESLKKDISCIELCQSELSQIKLFNIEINTEDDIKRDDYIKPTILFDPLEPERSLLHRIMQKAVNFQILHVDSTIANLQRTFKFDDETVYDAFQKIAEEMDCIFRFDNGTNTEGKIIRGIYVYDMQDNCNDPDCGNRGYFAGDVCPKCGGSDITYRYGEDTGVFITSDELGEDIKLSVDTDSVKNCFKLAAGDDLMTATIKNCNPNGTDYLWYLTDYFKSDMSDELKGRISNYNLLYEQYQKTQTYNQYLNHRDDYNYLINKYNQYNPDLKIIQIVTGYPSLIEAYYESIDFYHYLKFVLLPDISIEIPTPQEVLNNMESVGYVSTDNIDSLSVESANNIIINYFKYIIDPRYKPEIIDTPTLVYNESTNTYTWSGKYKVTDYSDDTKYAQSTTDNQIQIDNNYETFLKYKMFGIVNAKNNYNITRLFKLKEHPTSYNDIFEMSREEFVEALDEYCLDELSSVQKICQACIDVMVEQDVVATTEYDDRETSPYWCLYVPYRARMTEIEYAIKIRESDIQGVDKFIKDCEHTIEVVHNTLNLQNYLGDELWKEFSLFKREEKYENSNYVSDGLNNGEIIEKANEFIVAAEKELYKAAELQHTISATLKNLLMIDKFAPIIQNFKTGNWIRVKIDGTIYKLRLLEYELDYDNLENIPVDFSDVIKTLDGEVDQKSIMDKMIGVSSSYNYTQHQALKGQESKDVLDNWCDNGINVANVKIANTANNQSQTWDENGMLFKKYAPGYYKYDSESNYIYEDYDPRQIKIINSTISFTQDNWRTCATAIGWFRYIDPDLGKEVMAYGVNGESIVGKIILGNSLKIYNDDGSLVFDEEGLVVSDKDKKNIVYITPKQKDLFKIVSIKTDGEEGHEVETENVLSFNNEGQLSITGNITAKNLSFSDNNYKEKYLKVDEDGNVIAIQNVPVTQNWNGVDKYYDIVFSEQDEDVAVQRKSFQTNLGLSETIAINPNKGTIRAARFEGKSDNAEKAVLSDKADTIKFGTYSSNTECSIPLFYDVTSEYKPIGKDGTNSITYNPYTKTLNINNGNGIVNAKASKAGDADNADNADMAKKADSVKFETFASNSNYSIAMIKGSTNEYKTFGNGDVGELAYNPSTKTLLVNNGNGIVNADLNGNASSADSATTSDQVKTDLLGNKAQYPVALVSLPSNSYSSIGKSSYIMFNPADKELDIDSGNGIVNANLNGSIKFSNYSSNTDYPIPLFYNTSTSYKLIGRDGMDNLKYNPYTKTLNIANGDGIVNAKAVSADTADSAATADKATVIEDAGRSGSTIDISYLGANVQPSETSYIAAYANGGHIKTMAYSALAEKLTEQNIRPIVYSTSAPGSTLATGTIWLQYEE